MRIHDVLALCSTVLALAALAGPAHATEAQQVALTTDAQRTATRAVAPATPPVASAPAASETVAWMPQVAPPLYVPPQRGAPRVRIDGGTRSVLARARGPVLRALAPTHVGVARSASPTFYWYASERVDRPLTFILEDPEQLYPVYEQVLEGPFERGVHAIDLAALQVTLESDRAYQWYVVVPDASGSRSADLFAGAGVVYRPLDREGALAKASAAERLTHHASEGNWYDAVEALSRHIDAAPADAGLRSQRAALLEQVELPSVAGYDREAVARAH